MKIDLSDDKKTLLLSMNKNINEKDAKEINLYLYPILLKHNINHLEINMVSVNFINPSGYNSLLKLNWIMKVKKGTCILKNVPRLLERELRALKFKIEKEKKVKQ